MIKIAVIGTRGFPGVQGGVETHCEQLYTRLAEQGCNVTVFTRKPYVDPNINMYKGVSLISIDCPRNKFSEAILHTFKSIFEARKLKPDIIHIHGIGPSLFAPLIRLLGMKVVLTTHGENYKHNKWGFFSKLFLRFCEAVGMVFSNRVIAISPFIASAVEKKFYRSPVVIPNGVTISLPSVTEGELTKAGIKKHKYIFSVGRLVPEKGFSDLVDAFNLEDYEDWKLVIAGCADHEDSYSRNLKVKAGKNSKIILTGFLSGEPLKELYSHAGLFVLPSYYEGMPIALLEAMSYGLSCIVSDIPANRNIELSEDRFFKAGDVKELADKIREFMNKALSTEERERQMSIVGGGYNWDKIAERTREVYKHVLSP